MINDNNEEELLNNETNTNVRLSLFNNNDKPDESNLSMEEAIKNAFSSCE